MYHVRLCSWCSRHVRHAATCLLASAPTPVASRLLLLAHPMCFGDDNLPPFKSSPTAPGNEASRAGTSSGFDRCGPREKWLKTQLPRLTLHRSRTNKIVKIFVGRQNTQPLTYEVHPLSFLLTFISFVIYTRPDFGVVKNNYN